jgi:hypothetical protein
MADKQKKQLDASTLKAFENAAAGMPLKRWYFTVEANPYIQVTMAFSQTRPASSSSSHALMQRLDSTRKPPTLTRSLLR